MPSQHEDGHVCTLGVALHGSLVVIDALPGAGSSTLVNLLRKGSPAPLCHIHCRVIWRATVYVGSNARQLADIFGEPVVGADGLPDYPVINRLLWAADGDQQRAAQVREDLRATFGLAFAHALGSKIAEFRTLYPGRHMLVEHSFASARQQHVDLLKAIRPRLLVSLACPLAVRLERERGKTSDQAPDIQMHPLADRLNMLAAHHSDDEQAERAAILGQHMDTCVVATEGRPSALAASADLLLAQFAGLASRHVCA